MVVHHHQFHSTRLGFGRRFMAFLLKPSFYLAASRIGRQTNRFQSYETRLLSKSTKSDSLSSSLPRNCKLRYVSHHLAYQRYGNVSSITVIRVIVQGITLVSSSVIVKVAYRFTISSAIGLTKFPRGIQRLEIRDCTSENSHCFSNPRSHREETFF